MTGKEALGNELEFKEADYRNPVATNHAIFERDKWMVNQCDVILADLSNSGQRVSIGTVMELAWAAQLGKHSVVILPKENIHRHAFILESADVIFEMWDDAFFYLESLAK